MAWNWQSSNNPHPVLSLLGIIATVIGTVIAAVAYFHPNTLVSNPLRTTDNQVKAKPDKYPISVSCTASQIDSISAAGSPVVTDPSLQNISTASTFTLSVDGKQYPLSPSGPSLNSLVTAINSSGAHAKATVLNVGGRSRPDYRLSVQGTDCGSKPPPVCTSGVGKVTVNLVIDSTMRNSRLLVDSTPCRDDVGTEENFQVYLSKGDHHLLLQHGDKSCSVNILVPPRRAVPLTC